MTLSTMDKHFHIYNISKNIPKAIKNGNFIPHTIYTHHFNSRLNEQNIPEKKKTCAIVRAKATRSFCPNAFPYSNYQICRSRREQNGIMLVKLNVLIVITNAMAFVRSVHLSVCPSVARLCTSGVMFH